MHTEQGKHNHYAPKLLLRNFAVDEAGQRITTLAKHGLLAVWQERSIDNVGYEDDFYVHMEHGTPISVETAINQNIETPISRSETWAKLSSNRSDLLDRTDRPILYALIRHLEARTPHYLATMNELASMAVDPKSSLPFSDNERAHFALLRADPNLAKAMANHMSSTRLWTAESFHSAALMVLRSPIPLRTSTIPVMALPAPAHPALSLPLPGMTPYVLAATLNWTTIVCLTLGDFDGAFSNQVIDRTTALGFCRYYTGQFAHFPQVRHMVTSRDGLVSEMAWAKYQLLRDTPRKITFRRQG